MERLEGYRVSDKARLVQSGVDLRQLAKDGASIWIDMIFRDGFFHADPHPGNFIVLPDSRVGVLDCGMVGRLDNLTREALEDLLIVFVSHDVDGVVDVVMRICTLPRGFDRRAFTADVDLFIADYLEGAIKEIDISAMIMALVDVVYKYHVLVPANIIMLGKTIALLEGTSRLLDPNFDLAELAAPYFMQILERRYTPLKVSQAVLRTYRDWRRLLLTLPRDMADLLADARRGELRVQFQIRGLDKVINRLVGGIVAAAFLLGSSLMWDASAQPIIFGVPVIAALGLCCGALIVAVLFWATFRSGGV